MKPFVKRQKNDAADAEAIAEAARRPNLRFVAVKSAEHQARAVTFRTHQCFVKQRTQLINALRGHLAEFGVIAPGGATNVKRLEQATREEGTDLPAVVRDGPLLPRTDCGSDDQDRRVGSAAATGVPHG
ncbi:transposase [Azospirillum sp. B510]|uniref:IS110 family transposase n=1 Tax=Azospirillum sp. (strain B510) TaxID=137722 RepID=UPI0001C4C71E|nr:transposase [Azospirillum sp. B510]